MCTGFRRLREERGLTQVEAASRSGLSVRTIVRLEHGKGGAVDTYRKLSALYAMPLDRLIEMAGRPCPDSA